MIFIEQNYNPFLVNFVKILQPEVGAFAYAHQSFLQVEQQPCQHGSSEQIASKSHCGPQIKNLTTHYNRKFCTSFHFLFNQEPLRRL